MSGERRTRKVLLLSTNSYRGKTIYGFLNYVSAMVYEECDRIAFETYLCDCLYAIAGGRIKKRYIDMINNTQKAVEQTADDILKRAGIEVIEDG